MLSICYVTDSFCDGIFHSVNRTVSQFIIVNNFQNHRYNSFKLWFQTVIKITKNIIKLGQEDLFGPFYSSKSYLSTVMNLFRSFSPKNWRKKFAPNKKSLKSSKIEKKLNF